MLSIEDINFTILEVLRFERNSFVHDPHKRNRTVLSCRLWGEAHFDCNGQTVTASPTEYIMIPANTEYEQRSGAEEVICVHLDAAETLPCAVIGLHDASPRLRECFLELHRTWSHKEPGYMLRCKGLVYEILYAFCSAFEQDERSEAKRLLRPSVAYFRENFHRSDCSVSTAIELSHVSPAYFRRIFKEVYGVTPVRFLCERRIDYAKALLATEMYSMRQIAAMTGFAEEKYFYATFKRLCGTTPTGWKRR